MLSFTLFIVRDFSTPKPCQCYCGGGGGGGGGRIFKIDENGVFFKNSPLGSCGCLTAQNPKNFDLL